VLNDPPNVKSASFPKWRASQEFYEGDREIAHDQEVLKNHLRESTLKKDEQNKNAILDLSLFLYVLQEKWMADLRLSVYRA